MDRRIRSAALETLEPRQMLASISGTIIEDLDNDAARDGREKPLPGVTVFLDQNRNRQLDAGETTTTTDVNGFYEFTGLAPGQYFVSQLPPPAYSQNFPGRGGFGESGGNFNIELNFTDDSISTKARSLFESAAARWEKVIVGDVGDVSDAQLGLVDDIIIDATARPIDGRSGTLAFAQLGESRDALNRTPFLPYHSMMTFDTADADQPSAFDTIVHEMGHALGFTLTTWFMFDGTTPLVQGNVVDPRFIGPNATREYNQVFGVNETGVPLENFTAGSGSQFSHWREGVFGDELMSPFADADGLSEPMSRVTIGAMQDIGYGVNYRGADPYDPDKPSTAPTVPALAGGGLLDYSYTVQIDTEGEMVQGEDFISRLNRRPTLDRLVSGDAFAQVGQIVKLRAVGAADADSGDAVSAVNFYAETNGLEGLQTGDGGDTVIGADTNPGGGFRMNANTAALGLSAGDSIFYARAYDQADVAGKPKMVTVSLFDPDTPPRAPTAISAAATGPNQIIVSWNDRSANEFGFRVERARDIGFARSVQRFTLAADTESFTDNKLDPSTTYYYRVRAFNVGGSSKFSGPFVVNTLARGEKVVDNADQDETAGAGQVIITPDDRAIMGSTSVIGPAPGPGRLVVTPTLQFNGRYTVYARWLDLGSEHALARFEVTDSRGKAQRAVTLDQNDFPDGGWVQIGQYAFDKNSSGRVVVSADDAQQTVNIDALRFVPAFIPPG